MGAKILFLKPGYHQYLLKMFYASSEMILNLTSVHKVQILSRRTPKTEICEKIKPQNMGSSWVKFRNQNYGLQARFKTQKYSTYAV